MKNSSGYQKFPIPDKKSTGKLLSPRSYIRVKPTEGKRKLIEDTFKDSFNEDRFIYFIKNIFNKFNPNPTNCIPSFPDHIQSMKLLGQYKDQMEKKIDCFVVQLKKETSLERARKTQRNCIATYLKNKNSDASLAAFVSPNKEDWRFSFIKIDYRLEEGKVKDVLTPCRFSFLVGKNESSHTAQNSLVPLLEEDEKNPTIEELEKAFSVEKVHKEFFEKYRSLFYNLKDSLDEIIEKNKRIKTDFEKKGVDSSDFSKKLLGQIVFLYFLQKKGWFGVKREEEWGAGSRYFLRELFEKRHGKYQNFFNDILEPLCYEALSSEHTDDYYSRFDCRIPFLNGGLFEPLGGYDWVNTDILLPDSLFSNKNQTKEGDTGNGILDIFDRYNFTVNEDEPLEKEVAVDPEMLGKVFENLLEVKDRKSKGTYYTPREIVHYMCQQSLINYLAEELKEKVKKESIEEFVKNSDSSVEHDIIHKEKKSKDKDYRGLYAEPKLPEKIREEAKLIDEKLANIRVCDPAVGSGAFPVGMMNEIVRTRNALTPFIETRDFSPDKRARGLRSLYHFKRHAIEHCLYGVDIDASAIEIAKLRLWLSLVVDEEEWEKVQPLPNLDYKMICGNSLLGMSKAAGEDGGTGTGTKDWLYEENIKEFHKKKNLYFNETSPAKKEKYKKEIDRFIDKICVHTFKGTRGIAENRKIFDFEIYFSEVFQEKQGFDVVIGNPPYEGFRSLDKDTKKQLNKLYVSAKGKFDLYVPFIEKSYYILKNKGFFIFICPTAFTKREYGKNLKKFLLSNVTLNKLIDFEHSQIFEKATNYTGIFSFNKETHKSKESTFMYRRGFDGEILIKKQNKMSSRLWIFLNQVSENIVNKMMINKPLGEIAVISEGVVTGLNALYLKTRGEIDKLKLEKKYFFPTYRGADIDKYFLKANSEFLFYPYKLSKEEKTVPIEESVFKNQCPNMFNYLKNNLSLIEKRQYFSSSNKKWYELWNQRNLKYFLSEKIITPELSDRNQFMLLSQNVFYGDTVCGIFIRKKFKHIVDIKYLLAILNSKLIEWYYKKTSVPKANGFFIYKVIFLKNIPIKIYDLEIRKTLFIDLVDKILKITKAENYPQNPAKQAKVQEYEKQINQLVYKLYDLTSEEIKIIENS